MRHIWLTAQRIGYKFDCRLLQAQQKAYTYISACFYILALILVPNTSYALAARIKRLDTILLSPNHR